MTTDGMVQVLTELQRIADSRGVCHRKNVGAFAVVHGTGVPVVTATNTIPVGCMDCRLVCPRARGESRKADYSDCPSIHAEVNLLTELSQVVGEARLEGLSMMSSDEGPTTFDVYVSAPPCRDCMERLIASSLVADVVWMRVRGRDDHVVVDDHADYRHTLREFLTDGYTQNE